MRLLAFTAKKETGKTTAVNYLRRGISNSVQINFKDALIEELILYFPELLIEIGRTYDNDRAMYDGRAWDIDRLFKEKPPLIRKLMRDWGTVFRRGQDPDYWVKQWIEKVNPYVGTDVTIFTDDVRFINEAQAVMDKGGSIIKITTDKPIPEDNHQSESEMHFITPDLTIKNFWGDPEVMYTQLKPLIH